MSMISQAAKRLKTFIATVAGAGAVGYDYAATYAAGTVGALLKSLSDAVNSMGSQIAGILDGATFTGPVELHADAAGPMQPVTLQQLSAAMAEIPGAVGAYSPPCLQFRDIVNLAPVSGSWQVFDGGVLQVTRGGWGKTGIGFEAKAPGLIKVSVSGVMISAAGAANAALRIKVNGTYVNPEWAVQTEGGESTRADMYLIIAAALGDVIRVGYMCSEGTQNIAAESIAFEYFGPVS